MVQRYEQMRRLQWYKCGAAYEWIEMEIAKNREEYGLMKTDLSKQKIEDKKS